MKSLVFILFLACCVPPFVVQAQVNIITTICGNDTAGYRGDNGLAADAELDYPFILCMDKYENIYFSDPFNERVRKIDYTTDIITTIVGTGTGGYTGDSGLAINAQIFIPEAVIVDTNGNIYISDAENNVIRKIDGSTNIITTIAGNGTVGDGGDNGPAINAQLNKPSGLCFDKSGNIIIADYDNNKIRKINIYTGIISTIAGTGVSGYSGDNALAINAKLQRCGEVCIDSSGNIFIADSYNYVVRRIDVQTGIITTIAGTGMAGYTGDNGLASNAEFALPMGIFIDKQQNIFIADNTNGAIRKIDAVTGIITTVAGNGILGYSGDHGPATSAQIRPTGVFLSSDGEMFIADAGNNCIRKVSNALGVATPQPIPNEREFSVWPNPAQNELVVSSTNKIASLAISNFLGQVIYTNNYDSKQVTVNIEDLPAGVYILKIDGPDSYRELRKFVKE